MAALEPPATEKRRCTACFSSWQATPDHIVSWPGLLLRRFARRRLHSNSRWASRQGWDRCPSCLRDTVIASMPRSRGTHVEVIRQPTALDPSHLAQGRS